MAVAKGSQGKGMAVAEVVVVPYGGRGERGHEAVMVAGWRRDGDTKMRGREERVREAVITQSWIGKRFQVQTPRIGTPAFGRTRKTRGAPQKGSGFNRTDTTPSVLK
jgi:hypothetical protein